ncbi:MAG: hypothetical protein AB1439_08660 [candidate division FCPU426 bacterium]
MAAKRKTLLPLGAAIFFTALTLDILFALAHLAVVLRFISQLAVIAGFVIICIGLVQLLIIRLSKPAA